MSRAADINRLIGINLKRLRIAAGLSQTELGAFLPVTFQQVQKYENGPNGISAANLATFAFALGCHLEEFFLVT